MFCNSSGISFVNPLCKMKLQRGGRAQVDIGFEVIKEVEDAKVRKLRKTLY
jgi:hypothetical protein